MLLPPKVAHGVADGSVTLAFRRWQRPDVKVGSQFRTVSGVVRVDAVAEVDPAAITDAEALAAGWPDADRLRRQLDKVESGTTYRVRAGLGRTRPAGRAARVAPTSPTRTSRRWTRGSSGWTGPAATARGRWPRST